MIQPWGDGYQGYFSGKAGRISSISSVTGGLLYDVTLDGSEQRVPSLVERDMLHLETGLDVMLEMVE